MNLTKILQQQPTSKYECDPNKIFFKPLRRPTSKYEYDRNNYFIEETCLGLEQASKSYQSILQEESHTIDLLSIQMGKYRISYIIKCTTGSINGWVDGYKSCFKDCLQHLKKYLIIIFL